IRANSWYRLNGVTPGTPVNPLTSIIAALAGGVAEAGGWKNTSAYLQSSGILDPAVTDLLNSQTAASGKPKAYLNWLLLDEQYRYAGGGYEQVGDNEEFKTHIKTGLTVNKNGYLYIYVSNETPNVDVFFDNVQVSHVRGPLMEETHYYPFGLTMAGISSKAAGKLENKYKFGDKELQNREFTDGSGLEMYDFGQRNYDQQIGRWWQIDPMSEARNWVTPFNYVQNNPITRIDPDGAFDDYFIRDNGEISVKKTDDAFDRFYTQKSERTEGDMVIRAYKFEAKLDKNEDGLIALPNSFQGDGFGFNYTGSKGENYISGAAFAGLIGALKEAQVSDVSLNHWSNADGSSPSPSRSHKNGEVGDIRPLRKDESGSPVLITDKQFDAERNGTLMKSMKKFGWTSILSEKNPSTGQITPGTTHYSGYTDKNGNWKSVRHNNHYHAQRFHPKLIPYKPYKP
ncbi:MAG: RHS repeat-associated core domain-containing protein, partial [Sediminibacterium sp.]